MNSVTKNFFYNFISQISVVIVPIITTPYISRTIGADGVGIYSYTNSISNFFVIFAMLGISAYGQREIAYRRQDPKERTIAFWELFLAKLLSTGIASGFFIIFIINCVKYTNYYYFYIMMLLSSALDITWFFQGIEEFKLVTIRTMVIKIMSIALIFAFVKTSEDTWKYIFINCISVLLANALMFFSLKNYICKVPLIDLHPSKHLKGLIEFFFPVVAVQIYSQIDKVMLGSFSISPTESGYYEEARKMAELLVKIPVSLNAVLMPRISYLTTLHDQKKIKDIYQLSFKVEMMLIFPLLVGVCVVSHNFTTLFFGMDFEKVSVLLKLSCPLILFMCIGNFVGVLYLNPTGQQNKATVIYVVSAIINIVLNVILIPRLLSIGALIASIISEFISCFAQIYLIKQSNYSFRMTKGCGLYVFSALIMGVVLLLIEVMINIKILTLILLQIILGVLFYFALLFILKEKYVVPLVVSFIHTTSAKIRK